MAEAPSRPGRAVPALTVDGVVLLRDDTGEGRERVLLVERGVDPYRGSWVFPGGFVECGEDLPAAVAREVAEETGLEGVPFRQFRAYGDPARDPRGHTVSVVFVAEIAGEAPAVEGGDDAARAAWFPLDALPELGFDHRRILAELLAARARL
jgi:8-oxo-dGTP diphosphatase